ncbi:glycosyltransferase family 4 protein [Sphingomonas sp.]|uniref:glycosyltransferase family 4 protein n=1 Tax=Sphingomonas sp. TaxID=28214 RepID=UPI002ED9EBE3
MAENLPIATVLMPYTTLEIGGSHISGTSLAQGLQRRYGIRSVVIAPHGAEVLRLAKSLGLETLETRDKPGARVLPHHDAIRTPARVGVLRKLGARTLVHCNDMGAVQAWFGAARLTRTPLVYHNRGFAKPRWYNNLVIRSADHVVAISRACEARLGYLPADKRTVLTNPFATPTDYDAAATRAGLFAEFGANRGERLIGFVGNFWERKRPTLFIEMATRVAASDPSTRFVLFGRAGDITVAALQAQVDAAGIGDRVLLAGFRLPPEANLAALDLLVMPALDEPFGRTLVEALLLGVPYVAADDAGHSEIHARWGGGVLMRMDATAEDYAGAVLKALREGGVALPAAERERIAASVRPERHAEEVMEVYRRVAQPRPKVT